MKKFIFISFVFFLISCDKNDPGLENVKLPENNKWTIDNIDSGLVGMSVNAIAINSYSNIWFGTGGKPAGPPCYDGCSTGGSGVFIFNNRYWSFYNTTNGLQSNNIMAIAIDHNNNTWIGTDIGLTKYNGEYFINFDTTNGLFNNHVYKIFIDRENNIWVGFVELWWSAAQRNPYLNKTGYGLSKFDGSTWITYTKSNGLIDDAVTGITQDGQGNYWFSTLGGVSKFDGTNWTNYTTAEGLPDNYISCIAVDKQDNIWVGTMEYYFSAGFGAQRTNGESHGVSKFDGTKWTNYSEADGLINNDVNAIAVENNGKIWFGTQGGTSMFDGMKWTNYTESNGLVNNHVNDIAIDKDGHKWFATDGGVSMLN